MYEWDQHIAANLITQNADAPLTATALDIDSMTPHAKAMLQRRLERSMVNSPSPRHQTCTQNRISISAVTNPTNTIARLATARPYNAEPDMRFSSTTQQTKPQQRTNNAYRRAVVNTMETNSRELASKFLPAQQQQQQQKFQPPPQQYHSEAWDYPEPENQPRCHRAFFISCNVAVGVTATPAR